MTSARRILRIALGLSLLIAAIPTLAQIQPKNHSFTIDVGNALVCRDGVLFVGETIAASSLNLSLTPQVFDQLGTTLVNTGIPHTFTAVGEMRTFTVTYPIGTFNVGDAVGLSVSDVVGQIQGNEGFFNNTRTVDNCLLPAVPATPAWSLALLLLLLISAGWLLVGKGPGAPGRTGRGRLAGLLVLTLLGLAAGAGATEPSPPTFTKVFSPDTIGPGSVSMLTFTIDNTASIYPLEMLAFTDMLPSGVTLADPAVVLNDCGGTLTAMAGGGTIGLVDGLLGGGSLCRIVVNVTAGAVDASDTTYMNVSGDLTSDAGNSGPASDDLMIDVDRPGFAKSFSPSPVAFGGRSTLTFTIDNLLNSAVASGLTFTDTLPAGMVVASPANVTNTCTASPFTGGVVTAVPGSGVVSLSSGGGFNVAAVAASGICTVSVDVIGGAVGSLENVTGELNSVVGVTALSSGKAAATLVVTGFADPLALEKEFVDDPVPPGGTVTLEFTVTNRDRANAATAITFDDDLDATLGGLAPSGALPTDPCGAGSVLTFSTGVLTLTGGTLPPEGTCTFGVTLGVPAGATPNSYPNTAGPVMGTINGEPETGNVAGDLLFVVTFPVLTKEFTDDPVGAGGTATLEFTITNTNTASALSGIEFVDELTDGSGGFPPDPTSGFLPSPVSVTLPPVPNPPCGAGSSLVLFSLGTGREGLSLTGGNLTAGGTMGDSCTFEVTIDIPDGFPAGTYTNFTEEITATLDDIAGTPSVIGPPATGDVVVAGAPTLRKEFLDDPVLPGGTVTLEFTLDYPENATADATAIAFTDDLTTVFAGLTATAVGPNTCAGSTVDISTPTLIDFSGGTLAPGAACSFTVTLSLSGASPVGLFNNTTSDVTATVSGVLATGNPAGDDLLVTPLTFTKEFTDDPVIPGDAATLKFSLENLSATDDATGISFTDSLTTALSGLAAVAPLPVTPCGSGSTITGTTLLSFTGGEVPAGGMCMFEVTVLVPLATPDDTYTNLTSGLTATIGGSAVSLPSATDNLIVDSTLLEITKEFTDDPVSPGDPVTLELTLTNLSGSETVTDIAFSDDLGAAMTGLTTSAAVNGCPGMATSVFPTSLFTYAGATLLPSASCTITLTVDVPAAPLPAGPYINTTSALTGKVGALDVGGSPASDELEIRFLTFTKTFDGPTTATGTANLEFTITNLDTVNGASDLAFSDDLNAVIPGLAAVGLPASGVCGAGSTLSGTTFVTLTGASLPASGSCTFDFDVLVPATASAGSFTNTTSDLFEAGLPAAAPATALLEIEPPPTFAKSFAPDSIGVGQVSTLTFTIDNTASALAASALDFTDTLPAGVAVATPPMAATTCTGGTVTAVAASGVVSYTGGTVGAGATCTLSVDVTGTAAGVHVNTTGDLTSSSGNSGTATDTLTVNPPPLFAKAFSPTAIVVGGRTTLTFTIDNTASTVAAASLAFTDNLPAGTAVASPPNAANTCGGTVTAPGGAAAITLAGGTVGAGATCTIGVDLTGTAMGVHVNTTLALTSSLGSSGTATDTLTVEPAPTFNKSFDGPSVAGGTPILTFTITNLSATLTLTEVSFSDDLDAVIPFLAASSLPATPCGAGSLLTGTSFLILTGGEIAAGGSCTFDVPLVVPAGTAAGDYPNTTSDLEVDGEEVTPAATATLTIEPPPTFAKEFAPDSIGAGGDTDLIFTIDNTASALAATALAFTDTLPAGTEIAAPSGLVNSCGGTVGAAAGGGSVILSGGSVAAGAVCTITVKIHAPGAGTFVNVTGDLTSSSGNSGTATDTLTAAPCAAADGTDFVLMSEAVLGPLTIEVCNKITVGPHVSVFGPLGTLTLRAGYAVVFENGVSVESGGTLVIEIDPALLP